MGGKVSCTDCKGLLCWFCELPEKNWFLLLVAFGGALVLIFNCHFGVALIDQFWWKDCNEQSPQLQRQAESTGIGYGAGDGPHTWRSAANNQSPINIDSDCLELRCFDNSLMWVGYELLPFGIRLENNGHTVVLHAAFNGETGMHLIECTHPYYVTSR